MTETEFLAMRSKISGRKTTAGRPSHFVNLFIGLLHDRKDGSRLQIKDTGFGLRYVSGAAIDGVKGANRIGFPVDIFERVLLMQLHDLILPHLSGTSATSEAAIEAEAMAARIEQVDQKIKATQDAMMNSEAAAAPSLVAMLSKLDAQKAKMKKELSRLRGQVAANASTDLVSSRNKLAAIVRVYKGKATLTADERIQIREIIRQTIDRIEMSNSRSGRSYTTEVWINLRDGSQINMFVHAKHIDRMIRDEKGHPIKGGSDGKPQYTIGTGEPRWVVIPDGSSTYVIADAEAKQQQRVTV
jgi:hypothetical protein